MLLTLLLLPALLWLYIRLHRGRLRELAALGPLGIVRAGQGSHLGRRRHIPPAFFFSGLVCLLFGLARPEMVVALPRVQGTVILAFDVSNSMTAEDLEPSRIEAAKVAAKSFVDKQPDTVEIGVVAFSNGGLVIQPPTDDQASLLSTIDRLSPQGGTSLGQGIFTSLNAIAGQSLVFEETTLEEGVQALAIEDFSSAVVLLLTDGEDTGGPDPLEIAQLAAEAGVRIYPIGIGSEEGMVLEIDGFNILSQLNEPLLMDIAGLTNGHYFRAEDTEALQDIYENVDLQLVVEGEKMEITSLIAGLSGLLFLVGASISMGWFGRMP